jgi:hypothetical protein
MQYFLVWSILGGLCLSFLLLIHDIANMCGWGIITNFVSGGDSNRFLDNVTVEAGDEEGNQANGPSRNQ